MLNSGGRNHMPSCCTWLASFASFNQRSVKTHSMQTENAVTKI
jgi:hypothetical protein